MQSVLEKIPPHFSELCATQQHFSGRVLENFPEKDPAVASGFSSK